MKRCFILFSALLLPACSGDDSGNGSTPDAASDASSPGQETGQPEAMPSGDAANASTDAPSDAVQDAGPGGDASDASADGGADSSSDAPAEGSDASCPASWFVAPSVDPLIAVPDGGVILHTAANGTQNYTCTAPTDGGVPGWTFVGPEANLTDCTSTLVGHHQASDGGAAFPEWIETADGTYVVGQKVNGGFTPDAGPPSVPWLLLRAVAHGGTGTLSQAQYIQRVNTDGGVAPAGSACAPSSVGTTQKVPYTADYFFFGP